MRTHRPVSGLSMIRFLPPVAAFIVFFTACATQNPPSQTGGCENFSGSYVLDQRLCSYSRGLLHLGLEVARYPDGSVLDPQPVLIGIHQEGCSSISLVTRGVADDSHRLRRSFQVETGGDHAAAFWDKGMLVSETHLTTNLPAPIAIGARGKWYWRLSRDSNGELVYQSGYSEKGLFFLLPYAAHREVSCVLKASVSGGE